MAKEKIIDIRDAIMEKMETEGRKLSWLSEATGINYNTLHSCLVKKMFYLSEDNLEKINKVLGTSYSLL